MRQSSTWLQSQISKIKTRDRIHPPGRLSRVLICYGLRIRLELHEGRHLMEFCACLTSTAKTQGYTLYRIGGTYVGWSEGCNTLLVTGLSRI